MSEFRMPALGADMEEATVVEWKVQPGDRVQRGDVIAVVETTKGAIEVETFDEGVVRKISVAEGETAAVGAVLAEIGTADSPATEQPQASPQPRAPESKRRLRASPAARRRAAELGVNLSRVVGSGTDGAITLKDVEQSVKAEGKTDREAKPQRFDPDAMRQTIAAAMARSKREIPHYYLATRINMQPALDWLQRENAQRKISERLLYLALPLKAIALALDKVPELNGHYHDGRLHPASSVHIGVAVALRGGGLVAPALRDAHRKNLNEMMADLNDLIERARRGTLRAGELSSPTVTVSNMGERGVDTLYGVITPPQVAVLGLGRITDQSDADNGKLVVRPQMRITLAADHRVSDGHRGAVFLRAVDKLLQTPETL